MPAAPSCRTSFWRGIRQESTDRDAFLRVAALDNHDQVYVLVLNRQGEILARAEGRFDAAKAEALRETLQAHEF
jgi:hypothetical protein